MLELRDTLAKVLRCVRASQYAVFDHDASLSALKKYLESRDPDFRGKFPQFEKLDRDASETLAELAQLNEVVSEVIQRLESGEELKI
jgi:hypothetical protein